jgi:hypothetical protein
MPPKFASLKPEQVIRALKKGGFFIRENQRFTRSDEAGKSLGDAKRGSRWPA